MMTNVYRAGVVVATIPVDEGATCKRTIAGVDEITMDVVQSNGSLPVLIGDYIVFEGKNYYLNRPSKVDKKSIVEYHFSLTFEADIYSLLNKLFQQPVTGRGDFGLVDTLEGFIDVLLANINGIESGWTKGAIPVTERKLMSFDGETCRAVLNRLADEFDVEFNVIGKQISFYDLYENVTSLVFEHGQGKGLYELSRDNVDSNNTVTRGWFWGASKNIDYSYRVIGDGLLNGETRLVFTNPATGTNRIDNFGDFNKIVERQVVFEDVWPHFTGVVSSVSGDYQTVICPGIDFDVELQLISGLEGKVYFKSGDLQSKQFGIKAYDHASRSITLVSYTDEFGLTYPNEAYNPKVGDEFTFLDIKMPDSYVVTAESKLAEKAAEWMDYYSKLRVKYSLDLDPRYLRSNAITLNRGDVVRIIDASLGIDKQIRITSIEKSVENPYKVKCEISNILEERWEKKISKQVLEALNTAKTATDKSSALAGSAASSFFRQYFEVRGTAGSEYIVAKMPFASVGEVTAYATNGFVVPSLWDALPTASATVKGGIKLGSGLSIDANGIVSVTSQGTIQTLSLNGTTLSISGGNSVTIPATYTDAMARAACALSGTVYDSARLANVSASSYTRRDVAETIAQSWTFTSKLTSGATVQGTRLAINQSECSGSGLTLFGADSYHENGLPNYGFAFGLTSIFGTYGTVNQAYATYLSNMGGSYGWIFKSPSGNVASVGYNGSSTWAGQMTLNTLTPSTVLISNSAKGVVSSNIPSSFLDDLSNMFELVPNSGNPYIRAKYNFASIGEVTAYATGGAIETIWEGMPLATTTSKGGVIIGSGFNYVSGVLSVDSSYGAQTLSLSGTTLSLTGGGSVSLASLATSLANLSGLGTGWSTFLASIKPTTLSGYGITDASASNHTHTFASLTSKPTTRSGYGITDAEGSITAGTTVQYWRGDKTWQALNTSAVTEGTNLYFSDARARSACATSGTVYDSARLGGVWSSFYTRRDVAETIAQSWTFDNSVYVGSLVVNKKTTVEGYMTIQSGASSMRWFFRSSDNNAGLYITDPNGSSTRIRCVGSNGNIAIAESGVGNVAIGAAYNLASARLHIHNTATQDAFRITQNAASGMAYLYNSNPAGGGMAIAAGNGTTSYITQFRDYTGTTRATIWGNGTSTWNGQMTVNSNISATGEVTAYAASDRRLKTNIKTITNAGDILRRLRAVEYDWNDTAMRLNPAKRDAPHSVSFIAQEWEMVLPWATHSIFEKYKSIDLNVTTGYLVAGWNEHDKQITGHDKEIMQLKQRVTELENQLKRA